MSWILVFTCRRVVSNLSRVTRLYSTLSRFTWCSTRVELQLCSTWAQPTKGKFRVTDHLRWMAQRRRGGKQLQQQWTRRFSLTYAACKWLIIIIIVDVFQCLNWLWYTAEGRCRWPVLHIYGRDVSRCSLYTVIWKSPINIKHYVHSKLNMQFILIASPHLCTSSILSHFWAPIPVQNQCDGMSTLLLGFVYCGHKWLHDEFAAAFSGRKRMTTVSFCHKL